MENPMLGVALCDLRGPLSDLLDKCGGEEGHAWLEEFKVFLRREPCWPCWAKGPVTQVTPLSILELVSTVRISATTIKFIAKEKFVPDLSDKAKVRIRFIGENFTSYFLSGNGKIEGPIPETTLRYHKLRQSSEDGPIIAELGGGKKAETNLSEMTSLMERQGRGEPGVLLNNGYANIFYIEDQNGVLRTVLVGWDGGGWDLGAGPLEVPRRWGVGFQVFSRNSVLDPSVTTAAAG